MGQGLLACRNNSCKRNGQGILSIATHRNSKEMGWVDQLRLVLDGCDSPGGLSFFASRGVLASAVLAVPGF